MTKMLFVPSTAVATRCSTLTSKLPPTILAKVTTRSSLTPLVSQRHHHSKPSTSPLHIHNTSPVQKSSLLLSQSQEIFSRHSSSIASTANTTTTNSSPSTTTTPSPTAPPTKSSPPLTWSTFLQLRKRKRRYNLVSSILTSFSTTLVGIYVISQQDIERLGTQVLGLDPMLVLGSATMACGATGWLIGPFAGGAVFALRWRGWRGEMAAKEKQFYQRIKRYRADPSGQSVNNPVPDYYGEKVDSLMGYRRWLKDQRAFMKKRESF